MRSSLLSVAASAAVLVGMAAPAMAADPIVTKYNQIVLGNLATGHDTEGNAFIGGNLSGGAANFGTHLNAFDWQNRDVLTVAGNTTLGNINLNAGDYRRAGTRTGNVNFNGGGHEYVDAGVLGLVSAFSTELHDLSNFYAGLSVNSSIQAPNGQPGPLRFIANPGGPNNVAVFSISAATLASNLVQQIELQRNGASSIIINVIGDLNFAAGNFVGDWQNSAVRGTTLWNFNGAHHITLDRNWNGAILAPDALLTNSTAIDGSVFVGAMNQNGEVHLPNFGGFVPAPGSLALAGMAGVFAARRRRA